MCIISFQGCKLYFGVQNKVIFQTAYMMVMSAGTLATTKVKIAKIYALVFLVV